MDTEPVELELKEGRNRISFTQYAPNKGVSINYFKLKPMSRRGQTLFVILKPCNALSNLFQRTSVRAA
jgi:hypothetical protein